jgi:hypothetical protein
LASLIGISNNTPIWSSIPRGLDFFSKLWYNGILLIQKDFIMASTKTATALKLAEKRTQLKLLKQEVSDLAKEHAFLRMAQKMAKTQNAEARKATAIEKAKAKLAKLLSKTIITGSKANKAARKPGAVTITTQAAKA